MNDKKEQHKPAVCRKCDSGHCEDFYWKDVIVLPDYFAVSHDCPFRVDDEQNVYSALMSLSEHNLSRYAGDVWARHNFVPRYTNGPNRKASECEHIINHIRKRQCAVIVKQPFSQYKPWVRYEGFGMPPVFDRGVKQNEEPVTDAMAGEGPAEQLPLEITGVSWKHKDQERKTESPEAVSHEDTIELIAEFRNYVEGAGVDFCVFGKSNAAEKEIAKIHSRCKNMKATAEWSVNISELDEEPNIQFDCTARDKQSKRCAIPLISGDDFVSTF